MQGTDTDMKDGAQYQMILNYSLLPCTKTYMGYSVSCCAVIRKMERVIIIF